MTTEYDPLREPLRLLRDSSLAAGFEERLAARLAEAHQQGNARVIRFPKRTRTLLLVAAIALPAAAAATAGTYYLQQHAVNNAQHDATKVSEGKPLQHLRSTNGSFSPKVSAPQTPRLQAVESLPAPRSQEASRPSDSAPKAEERGANRSEAVMPAPAQGSAATPRIEALDPFESKSSSKQSTTLPKASGTSDSLRKATEQGAAQTDNDRAKGSQRELRGNENRGSDAAQQARERVQARERKGQ